MKLQSSLLALATLALSACSNNDNPISPPVGQLRVANAISDSTNVQSSVESITANDTINFGTATSERDLVVGNYLTHLTAHSDATGVNHAFDSETFDIDKNQVTTVFAVGLMADNSEDTYVVKAPDNDIHGDQSEVQFVDVASQHPEAVDIYVTAPGASLVGQTPKTTLSFRSASGQSIYTPGSYEIRVTPQGVPATVLFDSGPIDFPAATTDQFVLIDHVGGSSPFSLLVIVGSDGSHVVENGGV